MQARMLMSKCTSLLVPLVIFMALVSLTALTGCVKVAPYERGTLAHPTMVMSDVSLGLDGHIRAVSEGASGGLGSGGGGCGCN